MINKMEHQEIVKMIAGAVGEAMANNPQVMNAPVGDLVSAIVGVADELAKLSKRNFASTLVAWLPGTGTSETLALEMVRQAYAVHGAVVTKLAGQN